ncbi:MAG: sigma-70 family RNA polymerase sigma factor [Candidatus Eisenbacteria bacterium]|uniref:Sigma-70 family RNA polymerase sigma factor n=1 Tax=Eiseniibacteriota bacterium TaxID=2212470 RepID=A0A956SEU8_UNCEI|nr:sigma-70 family RNA polymerase sigma factor [Candidatus Eisenbacteria bacterium]
MPSAPRPAESSVELLRRVQEGDEAALERLCARYLPALTRWAAGRLPSRARHLTETADLVQETMVRAIRNVPAFEPTRDGALLAYLRTALHNRVRDELRRSERHPDHVELDEEMAHAAPTPLETLIGREASSRYEAALQNLRVSDREAVIGRLELGLTFEELADALGKPSADAARMTFRRALGLLAEEMRDAR